MEGQTMIKYGDEARTLPLYSDGRAYRYLGKLDRFETGEGSWCGAVALGAVGDCTRVPGHTGPHQNTATADTFEILPADTFEIDLDAIAATGQTPEEIRVRYGLTELECSALLEGLATNRALGTTGARVEVRGHDGRAIVRFTASRWQGTARYSVRRENDVDPIDGTIYPSTAAEPLNRCPSCHAPAFAYCLGWCPVGRTEDERAKLLHVHVETEAQDCDGRQHDERIDQPHPGEEQLDFLDRQIGYAVSAYAAEGTLRVREERQTDYDGAPVESGAYTDVEPVRVFEWREATEEGFSARTIRTCHELGCGS